MNPLKVICMRTSLAIAAMVLTLGVSIDWPPGAADGYRSGWSPIALLAVAHADDGDGGDGGDGDGGDGNGGDSDGGDGDGGDADGGDDAGSDSGADSDDGAADDVDGDEDRDEEDEDKDKDEEEAEEEEAEEEERDDEEESYAVTVRSVGSVEHVRGEVIGVAVTAAGRQAIERHGAEVVDTDHFPALGITLTRVRTAAGASAARLQAALNDSDTGLYDLNHAYRLAAVPGADNGGPLALLGWAARPEWCGSGVRIGIIDTAVDLGQLGPRAQQVRMRRFAPGQPLTDEHGTAIASLLLGAPPNGPRGALPAATLLVADVYRIDERGDPLALTTDLIGALDWLVGQGVGVINMSLAGPPDRLLRRALQRLQQQGRVVVAAAGNRGPLAPPAYPAAYPGVVAVTAVNRQLEVFSRANRGDYIDIAAPGVGLSVPPGRRADGTSLAAIYVSAAVADAASAGTGAQQAAQQLLAGARDLGPEGRDPTFGNGLLLQPLSCDRKTAGE